MSTATYHRLAATARDLIGRFGQPWTITRTTGPGQSTQRVANGVVVGQVKHLLGDSGVDIGDKELLLDASAEPAKTERIEAGGESYVIVQVEPIKPASILIAWRVWARAG